MIKPQFGKLTPTIAVVGTTSTTYNQAGLTYNTITQIYAGQDTKVDRGPKIVRPSII